MTPAENAQSALVSLCGYLVTSPTYGSTEAMWSRDLAEVLDAVGEVPKGLRPVVEAARNVRYATGPRQRRNALTRLRIEMGGYFEGRAVARVAALREIKATARGAA